MYLYCRRKSFVSISIISLNFRCMVITSVVYLNTRIQIMSDCILIDIVKETKRLRIRVLILKANIFSLVYMHLENYNRSV